MPLYFFVWVMIGSLFLMNLMVGVLIDNFNRLRMVGTDWCTCVLSAAKVMKMPVGFFLVAMPLFLIVLVLIVTASIFLSLL